MILAGAMQAEAVLISLMFFTFSSGILITTSVMHSRPLLLAGTNCVCWV
jgi:hypothetical protein